MRTGLTTAIHPATRIDAPRSPESLRARLRRRHQFLQDIAEAAQRGDEQRVLVLSAHLRDLRDRTPRTAGFGDLNRRTA